MKNKWKDHFKKLPFYETLNEKPYPNCLNNIDMFRELRFYGELNIVKTSTAFKGYTHSYSVEVRVGDKS